MRTLAAHWRNNETRKLLVKVAQSEMFTATEALRQLVTYWWDEHTRQLLLDVAQSGAAAVLLRRWKLFAFSPHIGDRTRTLASSS